MHPLIRILAAAALAAGLVVVAATPSAADDPPWQRGGTWADNDGESARGGASVWTVGRQLDGGGGSVRCWYTDLKYTTQEEQRTEIRPEEQRPGAWGWLTCSNGSETFQFFPEEAFDPEMLARSVVITPEIPELRTNPEIVDGHLVGLPSWYWVDPADWHPLIGSANAGPLTVWVTATPRELVVTAGDGAGLRCAGGGTPYDTSRPASSQSSACTHTYVRAGNVVATATIVFDVTWTSNAGAGGGLGTITPPAEPVGIPVHHGEAIVTGS
jgi:hypothetical protein